MPANTEIKHLYQHMIANELVVDIPDYRPEVLKIHSHGVLKRIKMKDPSWEDMVPRYVSAFIKTKNLFGYNET